MVKVRGYSVELRAIEAALLSLPGGAVSSCVVVAQGDEGEDKVVIGYVVLATGTTARSIRRELKGLLPHYMIPSFLVELEELPTHAVSGKLDKGKLPKVDVRGGGCAGREVWLANSQTLLLKVKAPMTCPPDAVFVPWVHYVPVSSTLHNLSDAVWWVRNNSAQAREIAVAAARLVERALSTRALDPVLPHVAEDFAISIATAAGIAAGYALIYALIQPAIGAAADLFGKARLMTLCLALLGVAGAMIAVSLLELVPSAWRAAPRPAIIGGLGGWWVLRIGLDFVAAAHA